MADQGRDAVRGGSVPTVAVVCPKCGEVALVAEAEETTVVEIGITHINADLRYAYFEMGARPYAESNIDHDYSSRAPSSRQEEP